MISGRRNNLRRKRKEKSVNNQTNVRKRISKSRVPNVNQIMIKIIIISDTQKRG